MDSVYPKALLTKANQLFRQNCIFQTSVVHPSDLPKENLPEFAFFGRSNVGKSSLLNALVNRKMLSYTSKTPGRTRALNFFDLNKKIALIDLPGYGFAKAPQSETQKWLSLINTYLQSRRSLKRLFLLLDIRHGLKKNDLNILADLSSLAVSTQIILTKTDKIKHSEQEEYIKQVSKSCQNYPVCYPHILAVSSRKKSGLNFLRAEIYALAYPS